MFKVNHGKIVRLFLAYMHLHEYRYIYYYLNCNNTIDELRFYTKSTIFPVGLCHNSHVAGMKASLKILREVIFVRVFSTTKTRY